MNRVIVHVDRVVLRGFSAEDRHRVVERLQQDLSSAFADPHAVSTLGAMGRVRRLRMTHAKIEPAPGEWGVGTR